MPQKDGLVCLRDYWRKIALEKSLVAEQNRIFWGSIQFVDIKCVEMRWKRAVFDIIQAVLQHFRLTSNELRAFTELPHFRSTSRLRQNFARTSEVRKFAVSPLVELNLIEFEQFGFGTCLVIKLMPNRDYHRAPCPTGRQGNQNRTLAGLPRDSLWCLTVLLSFSFSISWCSDIITSVIRQGIRMNEKHTNGFSRE